MDESTLFVFFHTAAVEWYRKLNKIALLPVSTNRENNFLFSWTTNSVTFFPFSFPFKIAFSFVNYHINTNIYLTWKWKLDGLMTFKQILDFSARFLLICIIFSLLHFCSDIELKVEFFLLNSLLLFFDASPLCILLFMWFPSQVIWLSDVIAGWVTWLQRNLDCVP